MKKLFLLFAFMASTILVFGAVPEDQFRFVSNQDGSSVGLAQISSHQTLEYSLDGVSWGNMTTETTFSLSKDVVLYVRGKLTDNNTGEDYTQFAITGSVEAKGNINYIWDYENLEASLKTFCGCSLFKNCVGLSAANKLELSTMILSSECYRDMFWGCTNMTSSPSLPATELAYHCYVSMFRDCSSLESAPSLPSTKLANNCYTSMFQNCVSLTNAPSLPAIELQAYCYYGMFQGCTSLITAPELPAMEMKKHCYYGMFSGCTALTTAPELPATTLATNCYYGMFRGCTSLTAAPSLPAMILAEGCYRTMFLGCTGLATPPALPSTSLAPNCYRGMFQDCSALPQAPKLPATTLADSCYRSMFINTALTMAPVLPAKTLTSQCYYSMFSGCSSLNYIKCFATDISASGCISNWVAGVASTGTFVKHTSMTGWTTGNNGVPTGWTTSSLTPYFVKFDANGGTIPVNPGSGITTQQHLSYFNPQSGYVLVYSGSTVFRNITTVIPTRAGHTFLGWYTAKTGGSQVYDNTGTYVSGSYWDADGKWKGTADLQLYARWQAETYIITWLNDDGTFLNNTVVQYGQIPTHAIPTKEPTAEYIYEFSGWIPEVVPVTGDATYTATYQSKPIATDISETIFDSSQQKVLQNGQLLILRGEKIYTLEGQEVR